MQHPPETEMLLLKVNEVGVPESVVLMVTVVNGLGLVTTATKVTVVLAGTPVPVTVCPTAIK